MNQVVANPAERVGPSFSVDGMLRARQKTREAIARIAAQVHPGMVEEDAVAMAKKTMSDMGLALSWHPTRVRFGSNTMKPMKVQSAAGVASAEPSREPRARYQQQPHQQDRDGRE